MCEVLVPGAHGVEHPRPDRAHHRVDDAGKPLDRLGRADGNRGDHPARAAVAHQPERRFEGRAGRHAVVDDDARPPVDRYRISPAAKEPGPALDFPKLTGGLLFDVRVADAESIDDPPVQDSRTVLGDGADRELGIPGNSQLVCHQHIEFGIEPVRHFRRDRNTSARNAEDEGGLPILEEVRCFDRGGETSPGVGTIAVSHTVSVRFPAMRRLLLLANPSASGFTGALYRTVVETLSASFSLDTEWPNGPDDTLRLAASAAENGYEIVAAMGGDGVVHHVANGVAGTAAALAIIPAGTTNVTARIFGLPHRPKRAAAAIADLDLVPTRLARIESTVSGRTSVEFATFAVGVGFDADVVTRAETRPHSKVWFGGLHYAESAIMTLLTDWRGRPPNLRVAVDGRRVDGVAALVQVHHPYTYFGPVPLHITREAVDGLAGVVATDLEVHRAAEIFARAILRRPLVDRLGIPLFTCFDRMTIEADPATPFQADGEHLGLATRLEISPTPDALLVVRDPVACCAAESG